jgi:hypothetical protein
LEFRFRNLEFTGQIFFRIPLLKSHRIGIPIPKFGIRNFGFGIPI